MRTESSPLKLYSECIDIFNLVQHLIEFSLNQFVSIRSYLRNKKKMKTQKTPYESKNVNNKPVSVQNNINNKNRIFR